jgi:predicted ArsR family transcriptional regulator
MFPDGSLPTVPDTILRILASQNRDIDDGWTRVPVQAVAATCRVHRATVWRVLDRLEFGGDIETVVNTAHRNGRPVRERWARLAESERILP